jgi:hypothetical protein
VRSLTHCADVTISISFRGSTREAALSKLVDAFESFMLHGLVENKYVISFICQPKVLKCFVQFFGYLSENHTVNCIFELL